MRTAGSPLRVLALLLGGWIGVRAVMLMWPDGNAAEHPRQIAAAVSVEEEAVSVPLPEARVPSLARADAGWVSAPASSAEDSALASPVIDEWPDVRGDVPTPAAPEPRDGRSTDAAEPLAVSPVSPVPAMPAAKAVRRWSGQVWLLWRPEAGGGGVLLPMLGGSQLGARLDYRLAEGEAGRLSLYGRASRALVEPTSEEVALGLAWRPGVLPLSLLVERRQRVGPGGRTGFAALVAAGLDPREVAPRVEMEGYAQAGIVGLPGHDLFADGKASLAYRVTSPTKPASIMLGGMIASSAQPGARRLDIGPELRLRLPMGQGGMRLSAEWRARVAGNARPRSGPAVTLIADF